MGVLPEAYGRETDRQRIVLQVTESWQVNGNEDRQYINVDKYVDTSCMCI